MELENVCTVCKDISDRLERAAEIIIFGRQLVAERYTRRPIFLIPRPSRNPSRVTRSSETKCSKVNPLTKGQRVNQSHESAVNCKDVSLKPFKTSLQPTLHLSVPLTTLPPPIQGQDRNDHPTMLYRPTRRDRVVSLGQAHWLVEHPADRQRGEAGASDGSSTRGRRSVDCAKAACTHVKY